MYTHFCLYNIFFSQYPEKLIKQQRTDWATEHQTHIHLTIAADALGPLGYNLGGLYSDFYCSIIMLSFSLSVVMQSEQSTDVRVWLRDDAMAKAKGVHLIAIHML